MASQLKITISILYLLCALNASQAVPKDFDCPMRNLALEFAQNIQPWLSVSQLQQITDALNGAIEAQNCSINISYKLLQNANKKPSYMAPIWNDLIETQYNNNTAIIYVDYENGNDYNIGSINEPLKHLDSALIKLRDTYNYKHILKKIILRKGKHYISNTIHFNSNDSNLIITNYNNESVILSAGLPLNCIWIKYKNGENGLNYYKCQVPYNNNITNIKGLRVNGVRAIRSRYPNGNPETFPCGFCSNIKALSWIPPTTPNKPSIVINPSQPVRSDGTMYHKYYLGIGGDCNNFVPNAGFICNKNNAGQPRVPSGMVFNKTILPNSPYANITGGIIQAWMSKHWMSWMFEIGQYNHDAENMTFTFKKGGFQGATGDSSGGEFYIENVFEELDYPGEFFYNTSTRILYYYNNHSSGINGLEFEVTNLKVILNYTGNSMSNPIKNVEIRGVTFRDTVYTYFEPHGIPSGGDWSLQRTGAIYLDNTQDIIIHNNLFIRLDGNAISINRYNRNITIYKNEITLIGDSAITLWGDTMNISSPILNDTNDCQSTTMGPDGTNGNQPRMINVVGNYVHELGIWEKQSSFYFQAKSCSNYIYGNIFYNGPRAAINFNDGFGGNSTVMKNLVMNAVRETGDHGPFNSWDRQVYVTKVKNGTASTVKAFDHIIQNFIIANYQSRWAIDNDDGSCYYNVTGNFLVYGHSGLKSYDGGHDIIHSNNIYGYIQGDSNNACLYDNADQMIGHLDKYYNNTCVINQKKPSKYAIFHCNDNQDIWPILGNNTIYIQSVNTSVTGACGLNEKDFQQKYNVDHGTVIMPGPPDNNAIIVQAKQLLW